MATTVIVWENNLLPGGRCSQHHWLGHASLQIGEWSNYDPEHETLETYVSWWPSDEHNYSRGRANGIGLDIMAEKYLPDHLIRVNTTTEEETNMIAYWNAQRTHGGKHWRKYRKNCSTMVAKVIYAGGIKTNLWHDHSLFWTPNKVRKLAIEASGRVMRWRDILEELNQAGYKETDWHSIRNLGLGYVKEARDKRFCSSGARCRF